MTQHELQKVIKEATSETLDSSQKLQMKDLRRLNQPEMVKKEMVNENLSDRGSADYIEGAMPNTAKFDSAVKVQSNSNQTFTAGHIEMSGSDLFPFSGGQNTTLSPIKKPQKNDQSQVQKLDLVPSQHPKANLTESEGDLKTSSS